jgi:hypothetical protein
MSDPGYTPIGLVKSVRIEGTRCWFYSMDHRPPHFHARKTGKWEVRVRFLEPRAGMLEWVAGKPGGMSRRERDALCEETERHREGLLREWEEKVVCDDPDGDKA